MSEEKIINEETVETVEATLAVITKALNEGDSVRVTGFGNFLVKERREKRGIS